MHLAALYGLWAYHYLSGQPAAMLEQANEFLAFAEREDETGPIMVGYRLVGTSRLINGYIAEASDALHQALVRDAGPRPSHVRGGASDCERNR